MKIKGIIWLDEFVEKLAQKHGGTLFDYFLRLQKRWSGIGNIGPRYVSLR